MNDWLNVRNCLPLQGSIVGVRMSILFTEEKEAMFVKKLFICKGEDITRWVSHWKLLPKGRELYQKEKGMDKPFEFDTEKELEKIRNDVIDHPPHYNSSPAKCECGRRIECIDVTRHMSFNIGNVFKYLWRYKHKNGSEDLRKAAWYLNDEINRKP